MARSHGRTSSAIWTDPDFIAMRDTAQRVYLFLTSQPDLSHAGLVPMRVNRWAKKAENTSAASIRRELDYLADRRFIVVDEDTEEVLIRTFVRNDGVYKQPLVMERMREDAKQIESAILRRAFAEELDRLPISDLSTEPGKGGAPSIQQRVERVVDLLRDDFADVLDSPPEPSLEAIERVTDTPHAGAHASPFPLPPSPSHKSNPLSDESDETEAAPVVDDRFGEWWDTYDHKTGKAKAQTAYRAALKKPGVTADLLIAAAAAYITWQTAEGKHPEFTKHPTTWLRGEHWRDEPRVHRPAPTRVQQHLKLAADLAADEQQVIPFRQIGDGR